MLTDSLNQAGQPLIGDLEMHDTYFWISFFGAPLFLLLVTAFVFRPSARQHYRDAKKVIFVEDETRRSQR